MATGLVFCGGVPLGHDESPSTLRGPLVLRPDPHPNT